MKLLTIDELAEQLHVPKSWIYDKTRKSLIPHFKVGKFLRFDAEEIEVWLSENRQAERRILQ